MYTIVPTKRFARSLKKLARSGALKARAKADLKEVINSLAQGKRPAKGYRDHALSGDLSAYRECHIKGDLLLIYQQREDILILALVDIGSHSQLFG